MRSQQIAPLLASALLAAAGVTLLIVIPWLVPIEERWNIVVVSQVLSFVRLTFIGALTHALVLGVPLFLLLRSKWRIGVVICALGGFLVGAVPLGALALLSMFRLQSASTDGTPTVINGVPTLAGWIEYVFSVGSFGLLGLAGGLTFWAAMRVSGQLAYEPSGNGPQPSKLRCGGWGVASVAVAFTCAVFLLPSLLVDRSCHNLFRDGRTSVGPPRIIADLNLPAEDWPRLRQIFVGFATSHSLEFREDAQVRRGTPVWRDLNLCSEAGVNIDALDGASLPQINPADGRLRIRRGLRFEVHDLKPGSDWQPLARDLVGQINATWPQKATFIGPDNKTISMEEALKGRP